MILRRHLILRLVPAALFLYGAEMTAFPAIAFSQVLAEPNAPVVPTRQLLEDARQRLIDRGELVNPDASPDAPAQASNSEEDFDSYRLDAGDTLFVNVLRFPDLSFQGTLDLEGNLLLPLAGALNLRGLTPNQAKGEIQAAFNRYVVNPQVDVILVAQRSVQVTILGEIVRPGLYPLPAPQLSVALVSAGGATRLADLRTVRIRRTLDDGSVLERDVDLFTPLRDSQAVPDVRLDDGDTIIVPTLTAEAIQEYDRNLIARSTLAQSQITIKVLNYATGGRGGTVGSLQLPNGSSFTDALAAVSPDLGSADIHNIALIRYDVQQGKAVSQELDGKHALMGDQSQNPILEQNDVIVIGRNFIARITHALNTFTQPFRDVLGFLLFFDSLADSADNLFKPNGNGR
ncbi:polysaccharide export protein [Phormidium tenue FACHB-886]|nr:polysaccharide export protein [Phormidium tenue FACHB-886]